METQASSADVPINADTAALWASAQQWQAKQAATAAAALSLLTPTINNENTPLFSRPDANTSKAIKITAPITEPATATFSPPSERSVKILTGAPHHSINSTLSEQSPSRSESTSTSTFASTMAVENVMRFGDPVALAEARAALNSATKPKEHVRAGRVVSQEHSRPSSISSSTRSGSARELLNTAGRFASTFRPPPSTAAPSAWTNFASGNGTPAPPQPDSSRSATSQPVASQPAAPTPPIHVTMPTVTVSPPAPAPTVAAPSITPAPEDKADGLLSRQTANINTVLTDRLVAKIVPPHLRAKVNTAAVSAPAAPVTAPAPAVRSITSVDTAETKRVDSPLAPHMKKADTFTISANAPAVTGTKDRPIVLDGPVVPKTEAPKVAPPQKEVHKVEGPPTQVKDFAIISPSSAAPNKDEDSSVSGLQRQVSILTKKVESLERICAALFQTVTKLETTDRKRDFTGTGFSKEPYQIEATYPDGRTKAVTVTREMLVADVIRRAREAADYRPSECLKPRIFYGGIPLPQGRMMGEVGVMPGAKVQYSWAGTEAKIKEEEEEEL